MTFSGFVTAVAGLLAVTGAVLLAGVMQRPPDNRRRVQVAGAFALGAAGLILMFGSLAGLLDKEAVSWGLMMTLVGTGVSFPAPASKAGGRPEQP